jgi:hypothetical protein
MIGMAPIAEFGGAPTPKQSSLAGRVCVKVAACGLFGLTRGLWGSLRGVSLVGFMVTDHTTGGGTQLTVANG